MHLQWAVLALAVLVARGARADEPACRGAGADRYAALARLLADAQIEHIEQLLPRLPAELLRNFTFVYASRSPDGAVDATGRLQVSPLFPRVVLFSDDARLVLAFTGDPAGPAYDVVEVLHFCDTERRFQLSRFVLPGAARKHPSLASLARTNGAADPQECLRCHGADPRPLFDSYPLWPGFYGSVQDHLAPDSQEQRSYTEFLATQRRADRGVYRLLDFAHTTGTTVPPYYLDIDAVTDTEPGLERSPNTRLGMALTELNRKRIARQVAAAPLYPRYRDKLLAGLLGCEEMPITSADRDRVEAVLQAENQARLARQAVPPGTPAAEELAMQELGSEENLAELDWVARVLGVDRSEWSMSLLPGSLALFDGVLSSESPVGDFYLKEDMTLELMAAAVEAEPALAPYFSTYAAFPETSFGQRIDLPTAARACPLLLKRTRGVASPALPAPSGPGWSQAGWALTRCLPCHDTTHREAGPIGLGSPIPFAQGPALERPLREEILRRLVRTAAHPMPPAVRRALQPEVALTDAEIAAIRSYVDKP